MFKQFPSTESSYVDYQGIPISGLHQFKSFNTHDQQAFAASNALCALKHHQPSIVHQSTFPSNEIDGGPLDMQMLSPVGTCQNASWSGKLPWVEPTLTSDTLGQPGPWTLGAHGHSANCNSCARYHLPANYVSEEYGTPAVASFPAVEQMPPFTQNFPLTPPTETLLKRPCDLAALSTSSESASCSPAYFGPGSETGSINPFTAIMEPMGLVRERPNDTPYAKLIERALLEADGNQLALKDIYKWFERNTDKASNPRFKGWRNSVRHNLSMNGAFNKTPITNTIGRSQKGSMWFLEPSAKKNGIQPTTRYRRKDESQSNRRKPGVNVHQERNERRAALKSPKPGTLLQMHTGSHQNLGDQQHSASQSTISTGRPHPYLPSPPIRSSNNRNYPDLQDDCTSLVPGQVPGVANWPMQDQPSMHH